jgi:spermidine synthase
MGKLFEEIDVQDSPLGELSLRRRRIPALQDKDIYEVKLGEDFLMSSLFVDAEVALADLGLAAVEAESLDVVVGGLGLGYTAVAALKDSRVNELLVVEALEPVVRWHQQGLVPLGPTLSGDRRTRYVLGNFFELAVDEAHGFDPETPGRQFDAILLDIDHSPQAHLDSANAAFYSADKLRQMARQLRPGGVFALWSNEAPEPGFVNILQSVFRDVNSHLISFYNPLQDANTSNTVYVAQGAVGD